MGLNGWFDRLPRTTIDVGGRRVPVFRSLGIIGFHVAVLVAVVVALRSGVPLVTALGVSAVAGLSFFVWGILRRAVTGHESLVLIEYVWVAYGAVAAFAWAAGGSIVAALDVYSIAIFPFLALGRLGCLVVGCCHGAPAAIGIRYRAEHRVPARLVGRRLLPVQLLEAFVLFVLGAVAIGFATASPGTATVWFLASYAIVRFGFERLRGDFRPRLLGVPTTQLMCAVQLCAAVVAADVWLGPGRLDRAAVVGGIVVAGAAIAGLALLAARPTNPLVAVSHLDEAWAMIEAAAGGATGGAAIAATTSRAMVVAVGPSTAGRHVSLSHPRFPTLPVALLLGGSGTREVRGITHFVLDDDGPAVDLLVPAQVPVTAGLGRADHPVGDGDRPFAHSAGYFDRS